MRPFGGDEEDRTPDPLLAKQVLSQLSYTPKFFGFHFFKLLLLRLLLPVPSKLNNAFFLLRFFPC